MGNLQSLQHGQAGLSKVELDRMERRLKRMGRGEKELAQSDFLIIPELAGNPFLPRIFELFDQDGDGYMSADDLRNLMESLTRLADAEESFRFAFRIYDGDGDGFVTREDLLRQLQATNARGLSLAQLESIVHNTLAQFDRDRDGRLAYEEFRAMVCSSTERNEQLSF